MTSLEDRVQSLKCEELGHELKPITMICLNPKCTKSRKLCITCIQEFHGDHTDQLAIIADIEEFIKKNSVQLKGSIPANELITAFDQFKKEILDKLNFIEVVLKEKIKQLFNKINNKQDDKLQQIGDHCPYETQLIELRKTLVPQLQEQQIDMLGSLNKFKEQVAPTKLEIKRLDTVEKLVTKVEKSIIYVNTFVPLDDIQLQGWKQPLIADEVKDNVNQRTLQPTLVYRIHKGRNLDESVSEFQVTIDHGKMKEDSGYAIQIPQALNLRKGEEYAISMMSKSDGTISFDSYASSALESHIVKFQQRNLKLEDFIVGKVEGLQLVSEAETGLFPSLFMAI